MMTKDVATVTGEASLNKAFQILYEKKHKLLPVVRDNKLIGLLNEKLLAEVRPSKSTALSMHEINYLMSRTKVHEIMKTDVFTISPDAIIEDAALAMYLNEVGSLPVVLPDKTVVGIITQSDIFKAFIELMGVNDRGTRISLEVADSIGVIANISRILAEANVSINHISNFSKGSKQELVMRIDVLDASEIIKTLKNEGYTITNVQSKE